MKLFCRCAFGMASTIVFPPPRPQNAPQVTVCVCVSSAALETPEKLRFPLGLVFTPGFSNLKAAFLPADFSQFVEKIRQSLFSSWAGVCVCVRVRVCVCVWVIKFNWNCDSKKWRGFPLSLLQLRVKKYENERSPLATGEKGREVTEVLGERAAEKKTRVKELSWDPDSKVRYLLATFSSKVARAKLMKEKWEVICSIGWTQQSWSSIRVWSLDVFDIE